MTPEQLAEMQDIAATFNTPQGQRVLARWKANILESLSYTPGDFEQTLVREGRREFVHAIVRNLELAANPTLVVVEGGPELEAA